MRKRVLALMLAAAMCASLCAGCGSTKSTDSAQTSGDAQEETVEEMDLAQVLDDAVADHDENFPDNPITEMLYKDASEDSIEEQYPGITDIAMKQMVFAQSYITGAPPEFLLVEVENADDVDAVKDIMQARIDQQSSDDPDYQDNADAWKNNAKITSKGNYVFMAVMFDADEMPEALVLE